MGRRQIRRWLQYRRYARDASGLIGKDETALREYFSGKGRKRSNSDKVFCIGFNKTGTTSLERILKDLGLRMPHQGLQENLLAHVFSSGRYDILKRFVSDFDAFQDVPFSQDSLYVALDALFPNSKFILTVRDADAWYESLTRFHQKVFGFKSIDEAGPDFWKGIRNNYFYEQNKQFVTVVENGKPREDWSLLYDRDFCISKYLKRNDEIIRYFLHRPNDFLCVDLSKSKDTREICQFLDVGDDKIGPIPHLNSSAVPKSR